jgi:hypothetical protein
LFLIMYILSPIKAIALCTVICKETSLGKRIRQVQIQHGVRIYPAQHLLYPVGSHPPYCTAVQVGTQRKSIYSTELLEWHYRCHQSFSNQACVVSYCLY